ncbi:oxidoreductase [Dictyobacter alpinus]|uniref:Oxidoreductase n=2 Tax=Dictyobacter alpinus TaxID=2014873 RepID=A0A402BEL9_9CHLR|nr:oxidoreductase [Dictyobacter alpinus]
MGQTAVHIRTIDHASLAVGWSGHRTLTIDRQTQAGGMGLGFSGGELLLLAIGGCYCNDLFREAVKRGMVIQSVQVDVEAEWGGTPIRAQYVTLTPHIEAEADEAAILDLITSTDRMAEIPNSLRLGTPVQLRDPQAITVYK